MTKYLFVATNEYGSWGGSELLWSSTAEKLVRAGNEVRVSARHFSESIPLVEHLRSVGCRIFYRQVPAPIPYRAAAKILPFCDYIRRHVRSVGSGVDLVVISQGGNQDGLRWMEQVQKAGLKHAVIAESAPEASCPDDQTAERLAKAYEGAVRAYFVSQATLKSSRRQFGTPLDRGRIVRNPFKVSYHAQPPWPGDPSDQLCLACVARLDVGTKAQDFLLEVLSLTHWRKRNIRVSMVGNGPNDRLLRHFAEELKLTNVEFAGHSSNIEDVWSKHHALILPSRTEGMPLVVVEAMLCGRPCIVTDVGGNRELVRDGVNGFLAKAPTVELLDEAMNRAWENRHRLREMGERAAIDVRQWVSPDPAGDFARELTALADGVKTMEAAPRGQC
jgi:glycosyltransferase involved in cell wall biosynthesis